jgi:hypothetical protein
MTNNTPDYEDNLYFDAQNKESEQQNDTLTEQWKKGELPEGHYYVKDGENMIAEYLDGYFYNNGEPMTSFSGGVDEVLAPVPSYEVYKELIDGRKLLREYIKDTTNENAELEETVEALKSELKEVCDVLIRKCPEMKEWVMLNWKNLYEVKK